MWLSFKIYRHVTKLRIQYECEEFMILLLIIVYSIMNIFVPSSVEDIIAIFCKTSQYMYLFMTGIIQISSLMKHSDYV